MTASTNNEDIQLKVLLLYRKQDWPVELFLETLQYLVVSYDVDIVTDDFNMSPNEHISSLLAGYDQVVLEPTHIGGTILDHTYVKNSLALNYSLVVSVESVFFSDHEAVRISLISI